MKTDGVWLKGHTGEKLPTQMLGVKSLKPRHHL